MSERLKPEGLCTACSATQYCAEHEPVEATPPAVAAEIEQIKAMCQDARSDWDAHVKQMLNPLSWFAYDLEKALGEISWAEADAALKRRVCETFGIKVAPPLTDEELEDAASKCTDDEDVRPFRSDEYWQTLAAKLRARKAEKEPTR
jgi:hypothetical protein